MDTAPAQMVKVLMLLKAIERLPVLSDAIVHQCNANPNMSIQGQIEALHSNLVEIAGQAGEAKEIALQYTSFETADGVLPVSTENVAAS